MAKKNKRLAEEPEQMQILGSLATLSEGPAFAKRLSIISWFGGDPCLDLRIWRPGFAGKEVPSKGLTLTNDEARALAAALDEYLTEM